MVLLLRGPDVELQRSAQKAQLLQRVHDKAEALGLSITAT